MEKTELTADERGILLKLARESIEQVAARGSYDLPNLKELPLRLSEPGVCFVTLTRPDGELRGCIGGLEAVQPLALDVCEHAAAAATQDYRFFPVRPEEIPLLNIEISRLTPPAPLEYDQPDELIARLRPHIDGVLIRDGYQRATFLPQVWEKLPDPEVFLSHLCQKMGAPADLWRRKRLKVEVYQVEEFQELSRD